MEQTVEKFLDWLILAIFDGEIGEDGDIGKNSFQLIAWSKPTGHLLGLWGLPTRTSG
jgi:hypothetical protein